MPKPADPAVTTPDVTVPAPRRRRPWLIFVPFAAFLVLLVGWTLAWLFIRGEVQRGFDAFLRSEAANGRVHECPERSIGGYPFRIELRCSRPAIALQTPDGDGQLRFGSAVVVAQLYQPNRIIVDMRPPVSVQLVGSERFVMDFGRAQASYRAEGGRLERLSVAVDRPALARIADVRPDLAAERIELHARQRPDGPADSYDIAVSARGIAPAGARPDTGADASLTGVSHRMPDPSRLGRQGFVADWARNGGSLDVQDMRLSRGAGLLAAQGQFAFNARGRADGRFELSVAEPAALVGGILLPGIGDPTMLIGPALALVGRPVEIGPRRGTAVSLRVEDGRLSVGNVQLGTLPPVF